MTIRAFNATSYTPTATADATNLANGTYQAIGADAAASGLNVQQINVAGQASASAPTFMQFARDSTLGATLTALAAPNSDGPISSLGDASQTNENSLTFVAAGTAPQRSNSTTSARLSLALNAFGGFVRWEAAPGRDWMVVGVTVSISESSLSAFTGGSVGLVGSTILYEAY